MKVLGKGEEVLSGMEGDGMVVLWVRILCSEPAVLNFPAGRPLARISHATLLDTGFLPKYHLGALSGQCFEPLVS